jgi:hypothetical protein
LSRMWHCSASKGGHVKHLLGHLFTLLSAVSLLLLVTICVLWARSYLHSEMVSVDVGTNANPALFGVEYGGGGIGFGLRRIYLNATSLPPTYRRWVYLRSEPQHPIARANTPRVVGALGFGIVTDATTDSAIWGAAMPCWFAALMTGFLPARGFLHWRRSRRLKASGRCLHCGYDLRASPHRCPECGMVSPTKATGTPF